MPRPPVPIANLGTRIPEAGRIRTGEKARTQSGKERPAAIPHFRFTSAERENVEQVAAIYGGTVEPFKDPKSPDRWQVKTEASEIRVALPADPLGGTPIYNRYGGGGPERRCDGVTCEQWRKGPDGPEPYDVDCICAKKGVLECDVTTHLSLFLPEIRLTGLWRLTTKSNNAALELPAMVEQIQTLQGRGIVRGVLSLKPHQQVLAGETRKFLVPTLGVDVSMVALAEGRGMVGAVGPAAETPVALNAGGGEAGKGFAAESSSEAPPTPSGAFEGSLGDALDDDEIVDAELVPPIVEGEGAGVDNPAPGAPGVGPDVPPAPSPPAPFPSTGVDLEDLAGLMEERDVKRPALLREARRIAQEMGEDPPAQFRSLKPGRLLDAVYQWLEGQQPDPGPGGPASGVAQETAGGGEVDGDEGRRADTSSRTNDSPPPSPEPLPLAEEDPAEFAKSNRRMQKVATEAANRLNLADRDLLRRTVAWNASGGRETSWKALTASELLRAETTLDSICEGAMVIRPTDDPRWPEGWQVDMADRERGEAA